MAHQERESDPTLDVLGRIVSPLPIEHPVQPSARAKASARWSCFRNRGYPARPSTATLELVGYKDPYTGEIRIPRRPLTPGTKVYGVDYAFLTSFYEFSEDTSIHLGNLVGYEKGDNIVPVFLDANTLVTEHLAVLAMTGSGKSYTVGRIIERLVAQLNASVVVFDPHGEYGKAFRGGEAQLQRSPRRVEDPARPARSSPRSRVASEAPEPRRWHQGLHAAAPQLRREVLPERTSDSHFSSTTSTSTSSRVCFPA